MRRDLRLLAAILLQVLALVLAFSWYYAAIERGVRYELDGASIANTYPTSFESYAFLGALLCELLSIGVTVWAWLTTNSKEK